MHDGQTFNKNSIKNIVVEPRAAAKNSKKCLAKVEEMKRTQFLLFSFFVINLV